MHGDKLVIHGHDAKRGLVDLRPHALGLDTACYKVGVLTGYLPARRASFLDPVEALRCE